MAKRTSQQTDPADIPFEDALSQLERIVERIESGEVGLEAALAEYERGVSLLKRCREVLKNAEQRVEELSAQVKQLDGSGAARTSKPRTADEEDEPDSGSAAEPAPF